VCFSPKNKISPSPERDGLIDRPDVPVRSDFGNSDSAFGTNFNTGLATQTFVAIHGFGLAALHFKNLRRASVYTLFITGTFIFINNDFPHGTTSTINEIKNMRTM
jgi:hypothetical protein